MARAQPYLWQGTPMAAAAQAAAVSQRVPSGGDAVELYHLRYEEVDENGLSSQVIQRVFYLPTALGAQVFDSDDFWYDSSRWSFHLWQGTVRHANGEAGGGMQDAGDDDPHGLGNRARGLSLPPLRAGDLIEVTYVLTPVAPDSWRALGGGYLGDLFAFRGAYPAARVTYVLRSRQGIAVDGVGLAPAQEAIQGGWHSWIWTAGPLAAYWPENNGPSITDASPYVQTGSFHDWSGLATWYRERLDVRADITPEFRARLLHLVPPQATALGTVRAIWAYLSPRLEYEGAETGVHGFLPAPPEEVFRNREGDCKDGALLMATWLRAEGISAHLALVRTWKMGQVSNGAATIAAFDHAIVYVPGLQLWIDTTAPNLAIGELPSSDQGGLALVVVRGENRLQRIPIAAAAANSTWRDVRLSPHGDAEWTLTATIVATGSEAESWRRRLYADRGQALARWLKGYYPEARLLGSNVKVGTGSVRIAFHALVQRQALARDVTPFPDRYASILASEAKRNDDQRIPVRWQITDRWSMPVGQCPSAATAAPTLGLRSPFGALSVERTCAAGVLTTTTRLTQAATEIAAADYGRFRGFWRAVDDRLHPSYIGPAMVARGTSAAAAAAVTSESK